MEALDQGLDSHCDAVDTSGRRPRDARKQSRCPYWRDSAGKAASWQRWAVTAGSTPARSFTIRYLHTATRLKPNHRYDDSLESIVN